MNVTIVLKRLLVLTILLAMTFSAAKAQDLIVTQNGETIKAFRTDVGKTAVYYRLEDNDDAQVLSIPKSEVLIIKMLNGEKIVMKSDAAHSNVESYYPKEPVADPEVIAKAEIGSLIEFYDGSKGVVFYLDGEGHGLAVSLCEDTHLKCWQEVSSWRDCVDVMSLSNNDGIDFKMGLGMVNCDAAINQIGINGLPAIKWCRSMGSDWYLPSLGELYELMVVANHSKGRQGPISKAAKANGGNSFLSTKSAYLSSSEEDNTNVFAVWPKGDVRIEKKYNRSACRAVRMF